MLEFGAFYGSATSKLAPLAVGDREVLMMVEDGQVVGFVDADPDPDIEDFFHVGYFVAQEHRGGSHATEALVLLGNIRPKWRLVAAVRPTNVASLATAHAAGFIEIGRDPGASCSYNDLQTTPQCRCDPDRLPMQTRTRRIAVYRSRTGHASRDDRVRQFCMSTLTVRGSRWVAMPFL